ncbi:CAP domain-containing protein [Streptomyces sp. NPDC002057]|uniref:CAP domain-containing protein n=1 Tax=Streptomyces sp. NPDC002057 TaxID=3154664 RepID=UPI00332428F1
MRHHDRSGHPDDPGPISHPDGSPRDLAAETVREEDPPPRTAGRHRRDGGARRRRRSPRPSFRTAVTVAGAAAAVLTVATGMYVASWDSATAGAVSSVPETVRMTAPGPPGTVVPVVAEAGPGSPRPSVPADAATPSPGAGRTGPGPKAESERRGVASAAVAPAGKAARFVREVVALANAEREKAGCGPLRAEGRLRTAAQGHADDMAARDYYEHADPEGRDAGDRMSGAGYDWSTWGENIHRGPKTPAGVMEGWMGSPGHRANILNCSFEDIGVGVTLTANGPWWVQNFGVRR